MQHTEHTEIKLTNMLGFQKNLLAAASEQRTEDGGLSGTCKT
jgi:hypothetical protein